MSHLISNDPDLAARNAWLRERGAVLFHEFPWEYLTPYMREQALAVLLHEARALRFAYEGLGLGESEMLSYPEENG